MEMGEAIEAAPMAKGVVMEKAAAATVAGVVMVMVAVVMVAGVVMEMVEVATAEVLRVQVGSAAVVKAQGAWAMAVEVD